MGSAQTFTMTQESQELGHFYAPQFEMRINGTGLEPEVMRDVREVAYHDDINEIDGFEVTVNNWDPNTRSFKYVGSETPESLQGSSEESVRQRLFDPCNKQVELWLGYVDKLQFMMKGIFTTLSPSFPSSGGPTLSVGALNLLHRFRGEKHTKAWENMKASAVAAEFTLVNPGTQDELPVVPDDDNQNREQPIPYLLQDNQYDLDFLLGLARRNGYVLLLQEEVRDSRDRMIRPAQIYFGASNGTSLRQATVELGYGKSIMEFRPTLSTANQVKSVTVRGWDRAAKAPIEAKASLSDPEFNFNRDLQDLLNVCDPHEEIVVSEPVFTLAQAQTRARDILLNRFRDTVTASVTTVGVPDIRAGRNVIITNVGSRFSGKYFVTQSTHSLGASGYTTQFNARREDETQGGQNQ